MTTRHLDPPHRQQVHLELLALLERLVHLVLLGVLPLTFEQYIMFIPTTALSASILTSLSIYLPIFNYTALSTRGSDMGGFGIEKATQWSLNFKEVTTFILPNAYGFGGRTYWGYLPFTDFPNYIGPIVILFALIGIYTSDIKKEYKLFFLFRVFSSVVISAKVFDFKKKSPCGASVNPCSGVYCLTTRRLHHF